MSKPKLPSGLTTPCLAVDKEVLERNIRTMAQAAKEHGIALRPHAKTHKVAPIAARQLAAGAAGLTVATIGEAEAFADMGVSDFLIAYPLWLDDGKRQRLRSLAESASVRVGIDSPEGAARIVGTGASVLIEVDSGHHRSGVQPGDAGRLAQAAKELGLDVEGVFTFPGHGSAHDGERSGRQVREQAARDQQDALGVAAKSLRDAGFQPAVVSGGSTPTARLAEGGVINELRPGVYVFNDATQVALGTCAQEDVALYAVATVVSKPTQDRFVLDAGGKTLGADVNQWAGYGLVLGYEDAKIVQISEHHAVVQLGQGSDVEPPKHGDQVAVVPTHVCNAVNLVDELVILEDGELVDRWTVVARGRNS